MSMSSSSLPRALSISPRTSRDPDDSGYLPSLCQNTCHKQLKERLELLLISEIQSRSLNSIDSEFMMGESIVVEQKVTLWAEESRKRQGEVQDEIQPQAHTPTNLLPSVVLPLPMLPRRPSVKAHRMPRQASMNVFIHSGRISGCQLPGESRGPQHERGPHAKILFLRSQV